MKLRKGTIFLTALIMFFSVLTTQVNAASTPFTQGTGYQQGVYDTSAVQPLGFNWDMNSRFAGVTKNLNVKWTFQKASSGRAAIVIDDQGNLLSTSYSALGTPKSNLYSISPDGNQRWVYSSDLSMNLSSPSIYSNKNIVMHVGNELNTFSPDNGSVINLVTISSGQYFTEPVIDVNGIIYMISASGPSIAAYNSDGTLKWSKQITLSNNSQISLSKDGVLYFKNNAGLHAYNSLDGEKKWEYSFTNGGSNRTAPAIDSSGVIYIVDSVGSIHAINPDGTLKWTYQTEKLTNSSTRKLIEPVVGKDGTIYATNGNHNLVALDQNGNLKWTFNTVGAVNSLIIDKNNKIYITNGDYVICLNSQGDQLWAVQTDDAVTGGSLAIGEDGTIYSETTTGKIYAIGGDLDDNELPTDPEEPKPPVEPVGERAIFVLTLSNGTEKEYDLSMLEVQQFISWYEGRAAGTGPITFAINKHDNNKGPFKQRQDYIVFDKIITFEVNEY
ncbi:PQQ-binding-like beta-propeller repeat protein [Paenibacillus lautus]|uniref:outer membrane protein assembly factor BamB family protein n=1 Tax=Paenibacillus lautus TaxID=1401 RepID=UPI003D290F04